MPSYDEFLAQSLKGDSERAEPVWPPARRDAGLAPARIALIPSRPFAFQADQLGGLSLVRDGET